jgi:folate-binding protein YgfZ
MPTAPAPTSPLFADLASRAAIAVGGPDWRGYLQGLLTQDVETLAPGDIRFAALLTPQGRLLFDLFLVGGEDGCLIDCAAEHRPALLQRLKIYRLRARVELAETEAPVRALWGAAAAPAGWSVDPRAGGLGFRGYDATVPDGAVRSDEAAYERHRFTLGLPGPADWGHDRHYPIEANFDLLGGIDFKKGCFVGQETTSRMKRRGAVKSRMTPIAFSGPPPEPGAALLAGGLRAGQICSAREGAAMALLRLDRLSEGELTLADSRPCRVVWPDWMAGARPA